MTIRKYVKKSVLSVLRTTKISSLIANSTRRRNRLLILCYHGISLRDEHEWQGDLYIAPDHFRRRLETLRSFDSNVITLSEGIDRLRDRSLPPRSVVITFDDGFYDFCQNGVPILQSFNYPCTLYLSTHYCEYRIPVFNLIVNYMIWRSGNVYVELPNVGIKAPVRVRGHRERAKVTKEIEDWTNAQKMTTWEKNQTARDLAATLRINYDDLLRNRLLQIMSPEEVTSTAKSGVQVELHTHRHRMPLDQDLFNREIHDNRERISEYTGRRPVHFCYPSGEYAPKFLPWLRSLGIESATTTRAGLASVASNPLVLPRLLDNTYVDSADFESWLCGVRV